MSELGFTENFEILDRSLSSYDECLINYSAVMVGTRLHAGIRALQKGNSALILSVDNRAIEIKKDINLPVVSRFNLTEIKSILSQELEIMIKSKKTEITLYKELFINNINNIL